MHYNYHRYYDPNVGRYLTPDPIGLAGGINLYPYALNNPVNEIDPLGLHGLMLFGRGPYIFRPSILRGPQRYVPPVRPFKETPINPRFVPRPIPPIEMPKTWLGRMLDKIADFLNWGGAGAKGFGGATAEDPCESNRDPDPYHPIYNPGGYI